MAKSLARELRTIKKQLALDAEPSLVSCLLQFTEHLSSLKTNIPLEKPLQRVVQEIVQHASVDAAALVVFSQDGFLPDKHEFVLWDGFQTSDAVMFKQILQRVFIGPVLEHGLFRIADLREKFSELPYGFRTKMTSTLAVPMQFEDRIIGVLVAFRSEREAFLEHDEAIFIAFANAIAHDLEQSRKCREAMRNQVTGLYHRQMMIHLLKQEIVRSRRYQAPLSLVLIDIDGFSALNKGLPSEVKNDLLHQIALRISSEIRQTDIACHVVSNTFSVIMPMTQIEQAEEMAERLKTSFSQNNILSAQTPVQLALSFGVVQHRFHDDSLSSLLSRADEALSAAKRLGGNQIVVDHQ